MNNKWTCLQKWDDCDWLSWHGSSRSSALHPDPNGHINLIKHFQRGGSELQSPRYHFVAVLRLQSEWSQYCFWRNAEVDIRYRWICPAVLRLIIRQQTRWTGVRRVVCWMTLFVLHLKVEPGSVFCCVSEADRTFTNSRLLFPARLQKSTLTYFWLNSTLYIHWQPARSGGDSRDHWWAVTR